MNAKLPAKFFLSLVLSLTFASLAHAAVSDVERDALFTFSQYKTFGAYTTALAHSKLATPAQAKRIEAELVSAGVSLDSEITQGVYTDTRLTWGDVRLTRLVNGDWKATGGRILSSKPGDTIDDLFSRAMSTLNPRNAQRTPMDLLIDSADAAPPAKDRASASLASSTVQFLRFATSHFRAGWSNYNQGRVECGANGSYVVIGGYKAVPGSWTPEKIPDVKVVQKELALMFKPNPVKKCDHVWMEFVHAVHNAPGSTMEQKLKNSHEFDYGPDARFDYDEHGQKIIPHAAR